MGYFHASNDMLVREIKQPAQGSVSAPLTQGWNFRVPVMDFL